MMTSSEPRNNVRLVHGYHKMPPRATESTRQNHRKFSLTEDFVKLGLRPNEDDGGKKTRDRDEYAVPKKHSLTSTFSDVERLRQKFGREKRYSSLRRSTISSELICPNTASSMTTTTSGDDVLLRNERRQLVQRNGDDVHSTEKISHELKAACLFGSLRQTRNSYPSIASAFPTLSDFQDVDYYVSTDRHLNIHANDVMPNVESCGVAPTNSCGVLSFINETTSSRDRSLTSDNDDLFSSEKQSAPKPRKSQSYSAIKDELDSELTVQSKLNGREIVDDDWLTPTIRPYRYGSSGSFALRKRYSGNDLLSLGRSGIPLEPDYGVLLRRKESSSREMDSSSPDRFRIPSFQEFRKLQQEEVSIFPRRKHMSLNSMILEEESCDNLVTQLHGKNSLIQLNSAVNVNSPFVNGCVGNVVPFVDNCASVESSSQISDETKSNPVSDKTESYFISDRLESNSISDKFESNKIPDEIKSNQISDCSASNEIADDDVESGSISFITRADDDFTDNNDDSSRNEAIVKTPAHSSASATERSSRKNSEVFRETETLPALSVAPNSNDIVVAVIGNGEGDREGIINDDEVDDVDAVGFYGELRLPETDIKPRKENYVLFYEADDDDDDDDDDGGDAVFFSGEVLSNTFNEVEKGSVSRSRRGSRNDVPASDEKIQDESVDDDVQYNPDIWNFLPIVASSNLEMLDNIEQVSKCVDCGIDVNYDDVRNKETSAWCSKCTTKNREYKRAIQEIITTEISYGNDLNIIKNEFLQPLKINGLVTEDQLQTIFLNLDELISISRYFSEKLQNLVKVAQQQGDEKYLTLNIAQVFLDSSNMLMAFETYCVNQSGAPILLDQLCQERELMRLFLEESQKENPALRKMDIKSFLILPVQRVMKYPLLLARLYKLTPSFFLNREQLIQAKKMIEETLTIINSKTLGSVRMKRRSSTPWLSKKNLFLEKSELTQFAVEQLKWNRYETYFVMVGKLYYMPLDNPKWAQQLSGQKFHQVQCIIATLGMMPNYNNKEDVLSFPQKTTLRGAALLMAKERSGKFVSVRDPMFLEKCIVATDPEVPGIFELTEMNKESFLFKAEDKKETESWFWQLKMIIKDVGMWRRRRNALANIVTHRRDNMCNSQVYQNQDNQKQNGEQTT